MRRTRVAWGLATGPLAFFALFFFFPLTSILVVSLGAEGQGGFREVLRDAYYGELFAFTTAQALISTALSLAVALPSSYVLGTFRFRGRGTFLALATLPFVLPTVVVATALLAVVGQGGLLNALLVRWFGPGAPTLQLERTLTLIFLAHVFYNAPVFLRILTTHWLTRDRQPEEAARLLGASALHVWRRVRLPLARPAILASALLVFIYTFTSFSVILLLGGSRIATVEVEIYRQAVGLFDLPAAAALSVLQMAFVTVVMLVFARIDRARAADSSVPELRNPRRPADWAAVIVTVIGLGLLLILPLGMLAAQALTRQDGSLSLQAFGLLLQTSRRAVLTAPPIESLLQSLAIAVAAVAVALPLGGLLAAALWTGRGVTRAVLTVVALLPLSASAVLLGLGFIIALDKPPLNLRTSWALLPIAHALVAAPLVVRSLSPALRGLRPELGEAAAVLGARPRTVWRRIYLPLVRAALMVGALFAFTVSMGEFGATLFIARPEWTTAPLAIYRLLGQPGAENYGQALALSTLLLVICLLAFLGMERLRGDQPGEI